MSRDPVSINIGAHEWEQRIDRLRALESVNGPQRRIEFISLASIYTAAKEGDLDEFIKALEEYSAEETASLYYIISIKGLCGNSLLHVTADIENADILGALLKVLPDPKLAAQANDRGDTALHIAARARRIRTATLLLDLGSIGDEENKAGNRALHEAVKNGDYELTDLLLCRGSISVYEKNNEGKCPLYLAVETRDLRILSRLLQAVDGDAGASNLDTFWNHSPHHASDGNEVLSSRIKAMSPVHGAVMHQRIDMLKEMSKEKKELFNLKDARGGTPLHLAASENYVDVVNFLVTEFASSAYKHNIDGYFPIHIACMMGHLETIKVLRQHWQDWLEPKEVLTLKEQQNILHVAAKYGRASIVKYILGDPKLKKLINMKDNKGNTPLHVATEKWQPGVLLSLTRDNRVNLELVNHHNFTALDIVDEKPGRIDAPLHESLTRTILVSAGASRSKDKAISQRRSLGPWRKPPKIDTLKRHAEVRMVVATLIAGVTFAAGFSVPGGYNSSGLDAGIAMLLNKPMYDVFVICNSIAMYNSIAVVVILLWTQINDSHAVFHVLSMTRLPLLIALATMSVAFMAGVNMTISKRTWVAVVTLVIGIIALFVILILYIALFVPLGYKSHLGQLFADYIIRAFILISKRMAREDDFAYTAVLAAFPPADLVQEDDCISPVDPSSVLAHGQQSTTHEGHFRRIEQQAWVSVPVGSGELSPDSEAVSGSDSIEAVGDLKDAGGKVGLEVTDDEDLGLVHGLGAVAGEADDIGATTDLEDAGVEGGLRVASDDDEGLGLIAIPGDSCGGNQRPEWGW